MSSIYESAELVEQYLLFHYGEPEQILPYPFGPIEALNFPVRIITRSLENHSGGTSRALDLGCAVGRSSFELSKYFSAVVGIDKSKSFIKAAEAVRTEGRLPYRRLDEAPHFSELAALRPAGSRPQLLRFETGDALDLRPDLGRFDLVLAANLVDRVGDPFLLLELLKRLLLPGGTLILTSPYTWLEEFTPQKNWLSNFSDGRSLAAISRILRPELQLVASEDQPFLIREHARKFQWSTAQLSVWRKAV